MNNNNNIDEIREKVLLGLELAFQKLVQEKIKTNGVFAFSENGKILIVKAVDMVK